MKKHMIKNIVWNAADGKRLDLIYVLILKWIL